VRQRGLSVAERTRRRLIEPLRRRMIGPLMARLGYDLTPAVPEWAHHPLSKREVDRLVAGAAAQLAADLAVAEVCAPADPEGLVRDFLGRIRSSPVRQKHGGNGFNGALQIYAIARALDPPVIVESGVFRGFTTWVLREACPEAKIYSFDPVLKHLRYRDPGTTYRSDDWSSFDFSGVDLSGALALFDDHISQERRLYEAAACGVRHILFDDDAPAHAIHGQGGPAYPTISMILAENRDGDCEPVRWVRNGREFVWRPDREGIRSAQERIAVAHRLDDMHRLTGYSPARLTYVRLKTP
jgi:hypothetical protein